MGVTRDNERRVYLNNIGLDNVLNQNSHSGKRSGLSQPEILTQNMVSTAYFIKEVGGGIVLPMNTNTSKLKVWEPKCTCNT